MARSMCISSTCTCDVRNFLKLPMFINAMFLLATVLIAPIDALALSANEVFEKASKSTVVVTALDASGKPVMLGTGVVMPGGEVATNFHVIEKADRIAVSFQGKQYPAEKINADKARDLCSLVALGLSSTPIELGSTRELKVGARVYAIGTPRGLDQTISEGIISSLRETTGGRYIQTTAPASPGSSGGGLFDEEGRLIGIMSFQISGGQSLNFAAPVEWLRELPERNQIIKPAPSSPPQKLRLHRWKTDLEEVAWLYSKSAEEFKELLKQSKSRAESTPQDASAWLDLGNAYEDAMMGRDGNEKAMEAFQRAVAINPNLVDAWLRIAVLNGLRGQHAKVIEAYKTALDINQDALGIPELNDLAGAYLMLNQDSKALMVYQMVLNIHPENYSAWKGLSLAYDGMKQPNKAIEGMQKVVNISPKDTLAWIYLGDLYIRTGNSQQVTEVYNKLKLLDPDKAASFFKRAVVPQ